MGRGFDIGDLIICGLLFAIAMLSFYLGVI